MQRSGNPGGVENFLFLLAAIAFEFKDIDARLYQEIFRCSVPIKGLGEHIVGRDSGVGVDPERNVHFVD